MKVKVVHGIVYTLFAVFIILSLVSDFFSFLPLGLLFGMLSIFCLAGMLIPCSGKAAGRLLKALRIAIVAIIAFLAVWFIAVQAAMISTAANTPGEDIDFVVVLGAKAEGDKPSPILSKRLETAEKYLSEHPDVPAVLCGGRGPDETHTEASVMAAVLTDGNVSPSRLLLEEESTSTYENLEYAAKIIRELTGKSEPTVLIITSDFHLYRAGLMAESLGMKPQYLAAEGSDFFLWDINYRIREFCGIATFTLGFGE